MQRTTSGWEDIVMPARLIARADNSRNAAGIAIDQSGNVWVAHRDTPNNTSVSHFTTNGTLVGEVTLTNGATGPSCASVDSYGNIWTVCFYSADIRRIDPTKG